MNIHDGHLCGGTLNGKGGTCVGKQILLFLKWSKSFLLFMKCCACLESNGSDKNIYFSLIYYSISGDSGGPLNCRLHKNGPWILAGIASFNLWFQHNANSIKWINCIYCIIISIFTGITAFGSGCSNNGYHPDVYIRTSYYIKWIVKTMSQN